MDVCDREASQQAAQRDKLHLILIYIDKRAAAKAIIPMDNRIEQSFPDCFRRIVPIVHTLQSDDLRAGLIAELEIVIGIIQLCQKGARKLPAVSEYGVRRIGKDGRFDGMGTLIR